MTSMIVPFVGRAEFTARENLADYIKHARGARFFCGSNALNWADASWDFKPFYAKVGQNPPGLIAHFTTLETTVRGNRAASAVDFSAPFLDAAKAIVAEFLRTTGEKAASRIVTTLRIVEKAFRDLGMEPDIVFLSGEVLDRAQEIIVAQYAGAWAYARLLDRLANNFVNPARLVPTPLMWKTSVAYKKPRRNDAVNKDGGVAGNKEKLPHLKAILDLSGVFHESTEPQDVIITSWFALAMYAPVRVNEVLTLPVDCETEMDGTYGLSWRPTKGGQSKTNFAVSDEWKHVAHEAIQRLVKLGEKSRRAAKWYEENPDRLYLPPGFEYLRGKSLSLWEAAQIIGRANPLPQGGSIRSGLQRSGVTNDTSRGVLGKAKRHVYLYTFESLENTVLKCLPRGWPYIDQRHHLLASEALFCLPKEIMRASAETEWYLPTFVSYQQIKHELGSKPSGQTIFERHGLVDPRTGKPWKLDTHQPRHLLNTLAQSKHVSQELIAFWSGRKSARQNDYYNHMPQEYYLDAWQKLDEKTSPHVDVVGPLNEKVEERARREMISRDEALRLELGSTITTRYGLCRHDYSLTPCPKDKDCIRCGENTFIKGKEEHLKEARAQLEQHTKAVAQTRDAIAANLPGADKWLARHEEKVARWQLVIDRLTDPAITDGALITLPPVTNPQTKTGFASALRKIEPVDQHTSISADLVLGVLENIWNEDEDL